MFLGDGRSDLVEGRGFLRADTDGNHAKRFPPSFVRLETNYRTKRFENSPSKTIFCGNNKSSRKNLGKLSFLKYLSKPHSSLVDACVCARGKLKQSFAYGHGRRSSVSPGSFIRPSPPRVRPSAFASLSFPSCLLLLSLSFKVRQAVLEPCLASLPCLANKRDLLAFEYHNFSWFRSVLTGKVCKGQQTTNAETDLLLSYTARAQKSRGMPAITSLGRHHSAGTVQAWWQGEPWINPKLASGARSATPPQRTSAPSYPPFPPPYRLPTARGNQGRTTRISASSTMRILPLGFLGDKIGSSSSSGQGRSKATQNRPAPAPHHVSASPRDGRRMEQSQVPLIFPLPHLTSAKDSSRGDAKGRVAALKRVRQQCVSRTERISRCGEDAPLYVRPRTPPYMRSEHAWREDRVTTMPGPLS